MKLGRQLGGVFGQPGELVGAAIGGAIDAGRHIHQKLFSGTITDKAGRKRTYANGKQVAREAVEEEASKLREAWRKPQKRT